MTEARREKGAYWRKVKEKVISDRGMVKKEESRKRDRI
jgi:hypothetical protein